MLIRVDGNESYGMTQVDPEGVPILIYGIGNLAVVDTWYAIAISLEK